VIRSAGAESGESQAFTNKNSIELVSLTTGSEVEKRKNDPFSTLYGKLVARAIVWSPRSSKARTRRFSSTAGIAPIVTADFDCPDFAGALLTFSKLNERKP